MLLSNGRIYTLDPHDRVVDTLVTCPETEIAAIEPVLTLVGGEIVLDRRPPS